MPEGGSSSLNDWQNPENYAWTLNLTRRGLAWELLRRNTGYRAYWLASSASQSMIKDPSGVVFVRTDNAGTAPQWGLLGPLADPDQDARKSRVFWSPKICRDILSVMSTPASTVDAAFPQASSLTCDTLIYLDPIGQQHTLFDHDGRCLQLVVTGTSLLERVKLTAEVDVTSKGSGARHYRAIERLRDLQTHRELRAHLYAPIKGATRFVEILQTIDGMLLDVSHKDIAVALFGSRRVTEEWAGQNRHMRDKVRKTIKRAETLVSGKYLMLLR